MINKTQIEENNHFKSEKCFSNSLLVGDIKGKNELINRWGRLLSKSDVKRENKLSSRLPSCGALSTKRIVAGLEEKKGREEEKIEKHRNRREVVMRERNMKEINCIIKEKKQTDKNVSSRDMTNSLLKVERKFVRIGARPQHFSDSEPDSDDDSVTQIYDTNERKNY